MHAFLQLVIHSCNIQKNIIKFLLYEALNQALASKGDDSNICETRARQQGYSAGLQTPELILDDQCM